MPVSADGQFELMTGPPLLMGPDTDYELATITGLLAGPIRSSDLDFVGDGTYPARDTKGPMTIAFDLEIHGVPGADMMGKVDAFLEAWQIRENPDDNVRLAWRLPGQADVRYVWGRPRRVGGQWDLAADMGLLKAAADFFVPLPVIRKLDDDTVVLF